MSKALTSVQNFYKTTITLACGAGVGKIYVSVLPTPAAGYLVFSPSNTSKREIIYYTAQGSDTNGNYIEVTNVADRGLGGTTAQSHEAQESIRMNITGVHWDDMIVEVLTNIPAAIAAVAAQLASKAGLAFNNIFTGNNTFNGGSIFTQKIQANAGLQSPSTIQAADPVNSDDVATKSYVLSVAYGGSVASGFISPQISYNAKGLPQCVHDLDSGKTYIFIYRVGDFRLDGVFDGVNTWVLNYNSAGTVLSISKH